VRPISSPLFAWTLLAGAWGLAFSLACSLTASSPLPARAEGLTDLLLGESRQALSLTFFNQADQYFHKGVGHIESQANTHSLFQRWQGDIIPEQHAHAEGGESAEILPWLKLATRADPNNVDAFLVSAFWAATGLHRNDLAKQILAEAQRLNPGDYRIPLEKGRMAIRIRDFDSAFFSLESALSLQADSTASRAEPDRQFALDKAEILVFLGFLNELRGTPSKAIDCFKNALAIFPDRVYIKERVDLLEAGHIPADSARSLLDKLTQRTVHDACQKDEGHDHDHSREGAEHAD
jgi:tetratricopeptide (TPR) repeat protein